MILRAAVIAPLSRNPHQAETKHTGVPPYHARYHEPRSAVMSSESRTREVSCILPRLFRPKRTNYPAYRRQPRMIRFIFRYLLSHRQPRGHTLLATVQRYVVHPLCAGSKLSTPHNMIYVDHHHGYRKKDTRGENKQ